MIKKTLFLLSITLLGCLDAYSQKDDIVLYNQNWEKKKLYWGYYFGANYNSYKVSYLNTNDTFVELQPTASFHLGMIGGLRFNDYWSLRFEPGFMNTNIGVEFQEITSSTNTKREVQANYIRLPLLVKFNSKRYRNIRPYLIGGISYDHNLSGDENNEEDNEEGVFRMSESNFTYEMGVGMDIYLPYFIFSPSIRGVFAINNEIVYDNDPNSEFTRNIDYFGGRGVFIRFAFH